MICRWIAVTFAYVFAWGVMSPPLQAADRDENVVESFDIARNGDVILAPIMIGGQQYRFLLDTCDTRATVDVTLQSELESLETSTTFRGKSHDAYRLAATLAGKAHLSVLDDEAVCIDLSRDRKIYGHDIRGKLGMKFLKSHIIRIDFDAGKFLILKAVPRSAGSEMRIFYDAWNCPRLNAAIDDDETIALALDLSNGSTRGDISLRGFHLDHQIEKGQFDLKSPPAWSWMLDSEKLDRRGWLDHLCLGEFRHNHVTVREGSHNTLGLGILSRYVVTFDFPNDRLYLKKGRRVADPSRMDLSGLQLVRVDGGIRIESVRPDSPAAAAGLQGRDNILQVNGKSTSSLSLFELRSLLMAEGSRIPLEVTGRAGRRQVEMLLTTPKAAVSAPAADAVSPDEAAAVRDSRSILFEGATSFDAEQIRKQLALDIDFQVACHPSSPLPEYLKQLEDILLSGYRSSGFPNAGVKARFEPKQQQVIVRVQEGPRYRCSSVQITGLDDQETAALALELTQEAPPQYAVPIVVSRSDGTKQTVWETVTGKQVNLLKPLWKVGDPASFDKSLLADVGQRVTDWLWGRGRVLADFRTEVKVENESAAATLVIAVADRGMPATVGEIKVEGARINSADGALQFLGIRRGMPFDGRLEARLERRLWESGRLISGRLTLAHPVRTERGAQINLTVVLVENPKAPSLATPLEPYEQSLLKLRDWVVQWSEGLHDEDIIIDIQLDASVADDKTLPVDKQQVSPAKAYELHVVTSSRSGQVISAQIKKEGKPAFAQTFIARDCRAIFYSPMTATSLEFEHSTTTQLLIDVTLGAVKPESAKKLGIYFNLGGGIKSNSARTATALSLRACIAPLAVLLEGKQLADSEFKSEGGILTLRTEGLNLQIDEKTGRLLQFEVTGKEWGMIRCRTSRGALQPELDRQERLMAGSTNVFDAKRPEGSLLVYWIDEYRRLFQDDLTPEQQASLAALQKLCRNWSIETVSELFSHFVDNDRSANAFRLPKKQIQWAHPAMSIVDYDGAGTAAGYLLPIYRKLMPQAGWLWPVGRDGLFALMGRPIGTWDDIGQYQAVVESGPLGHLTSALALAPFSPRVSQKLVSQAAKRMSARAFAEDYAPLLDGDSWLGRNVLSLAEALRLLDVSEIEALVRLFTPDSHHRAVADSLLLLKVDTQAPARNVLPEVCDELWRSTLKLHVERALTSLTSGGSSGKSGMFQNSKNDPLKSEAQSDDVKRDPTNQQFRFGLKAEDFKSELNAKDLKFDLKKSGYENEAASKPE